MEERCSLAPVASRIRTYGVGLDELSTAYFKAIHEMPVMRKWVQGAKNEPMVIENYEFD